MYRPLLLATLFALPAHAAAPASHADRHAPTHAAVNDLRTEVVFPEPIKHATLSNMRDHLLAIQEITAYLADSKFDDAASVAETRLGMGAMRGHGAHRVGRHMPPAMREIGLGLHRRASEFAVKAQDAGATGDVRPALAALARMQQSCVACHAAYRLQ